MGPIDILYDRCDFAMDDVEVSRQISLGGNHQSSVHRVAFEDLLVRNDMSSEGAHDLLILRYRERFLAEIRGEDLVMLYQVLELLYCESFSRKGSSHELESKALQDFHAHLSRTEIDLQVGLSCRCAVRVVLRGVVDWVGDRLSNDLNNRRAVVLGRKLREIGFELEVD